MARWLGIGVLCGYALACAALCEYQSHLIFEPDRTLHSRPTDYAFPVMDVAIPLLHRGSASGMLHGWWIPASRPDAKVVLYLHGNDGNVSTSMGEIAPLRELGYSVLLIDYRGYGASGAEFPSEAAVYEDAETAWNYLTRERRANPAELYIYGHSLGGAIAIELALRHPEAAGLIVESSFTSIYDMAALEEPYALLPVKLFLNQRFDSIQKVGQLRLPVLYIHGTADEIVPFSMGEQLFSATQCNKRFVPIPSGKHDNNAIAGGTAFLAAIRSFVAETGRDSTGALASR
jgi:uncharacterized protein